MAPKRIIIAALLLCYSSLFGYITHIKQVAPQKQAQAQKITVKPIPQKNTQETPIAKRVYKPNNKQALEKITF